MNDAPNAITLVNIGGRPRLVPLAQARVTIVVYFAPGKRAGSRDRSSSADD
jgi:hypothetical protein